MSTLHRFPKITRIIFVFSTALINLALRPMPLLQDNPSLTVSNGAVFVAIAGILLGLVFVTVGILLLMRVRRE